MIVGAGDKASCNLHQDCAAFDQTIKEVTGRQAFHCHDSNCFHCAWIMRKIKHGGTETGNHTRNGN
jgi:hypothetical protein